MTNESGGENDRAASDTPMFKPVTNATKLSYRTLGCHLLDKRLVKCSKTTSPIELCDLLTTAKQLVHVKHRKGGSAGLSHLFAQGSVSAEVMLGDRAFRKEARKVLRRVHRTARDIVPIDGLKSTDYEVVFLILEIKGSDTNGATNGAKLRGGFKSQPHRRMEAGMRYCSVRAQQDRI